jgi:hypothetical protein
MTFMQWLLTNVGKSIDLDGAYGPQCMDAINSYLENVLLLPHAKGDARDVPSQTFPGMEWRENSAINAPRPGSIVVWRPGAHGMVRISQFGHVSISVIADRYGIISADQNWLGVPRLELCLHNYDGVWGWFHLT